MQKLRMQLIRLNLKKTLVFNKQHMFVPKDKINKKNNSLVLMHSSEFHSCNQ